MSYTLAPCFPIARLARSLKIESSDRHEEHHMAGNEKAKSKRIKGRSHDEPGSLGMLNDSA
jgi:hypothetical protein